MNLQELYDALKKAKVQLDDADINDKRTRELKILIAQVKKEMILIALNRLLKFQQWKFPIFQNYQVLLIRYR